MVLRSVIMTFGMLSWSFNIVCHTSKAQLTLFSFSLFKNANSTEITLITSRSGSMYLLVLYVESIMSIMENVLNNLMEST